MSSVLQILLFLGVILAIITLVGHGIWVFLAYLFRGDRRKQKYQACPFCGKSTPSEKNLCQWCLRDLTSTLAVELTDIEAMLRQLKRFEKQKSIDAEILNNVTKRVQTYREELLYPHRHIVAEVVEEPIAPVISKTPEPLPATEALRPMVIAPVEQPAVVHAKRQAIIFPRSEDIAKPKTPEPPTPIPPQKSWAEILGGFLAERNIRWTELIGVLLGGLLMVGCSIALVIAFWSQLESIPTLKFLVFVGYSSAVFAAGLFVFNRWKLESTGRGLMIIATLLVPLNFLAMASFYKQQWAWHTVATELISLGIFTWLAALAARALTPDSRWNTVLAVIGNSVLVLLAAWLFSAQTSPEWLIVAGCLPPLLLITSIGSHFLFRPDHKKYDVAAANSLFTFLGIAMFCTAVPLGLVTAQGCKFIDLSTALHCLAIPFALAPLGIMIVGLQAVRGMADDPQLEGYRTAGTAAALTGVALQIGSILLAWPQPLLIIAVGIIGAASLIYLALHYDFPAAHVGAMICLTVAYLAGFHTIFNEGLQNLQRQSLIVQSDSLSGDLLRMIVSSRSGAALGGLFLAFAAIYQWLMLRGKKSHGKMYLGGTGAAAIVGLMLVTAHGFTGGYADAMRATFLYAAYGIVCVLLSMRWPIATILSYLGWNLLAMAPMWLIRSPALDVWQNTAAMAGCLFWLSVIWVLMAWIHKKSPLFTAAQIVLIPATLLATLSILERQLWITSLPKDLYNLENLQVFGIGLGLLSLTWIAIRIASRHTKGGNSWSELFQTKPEIDKITTYFVALAQLILAGGLFIYGCGQELQALPAVINPMQISACGICAWVLLGILTLVIVATLWERWQRAELEICLLLAASAPILIADRFASDLAVASAGRWALAIGFVTCSSAVWARKQLHWLCHKLHARLEMPEQASSMARGMSVILMAFPVLLLTLAAAAIQLCNFKLNGPLAGTLFDKIGPNLSYLVPLALVMAGLIGHALRESSAGYAFGAGLVAEMALILGYALHVTMAIPPRYFDIPEFITMIQLAVITAAAWALIWLIARRWVNVWREGRAETPLMNVQLGMAILGNLLLIAPSIIEIVMAHRPQLDWAIYAGLPLGWCALLLTAGAGAFRRLQIRQPWKPHFVGLTGMAALALLACTALNIVLPDGTALDGIWAYRILMLGWAIYALLVALATWWVATLRTLPNAEGPPQALIRLAAVWVRVAGIAAVILGLKAAFLHADVDNERLWAAAAIAIAGTAGATMAVWRRREGWAFAAAVGVNIAASLVVWHFEEALHLSFDQWWVRLVQANVIASALVALFWLAAHKKLYALREWSLADSPLLALQTALPVLGNAAILVAPVIALLVHPQGLSLWMRDFSDPPGWLSLLICAAAATWYLYQTRTGSLLHVLGGVTLGAGVLFACTASGTNIVPHDKWTEYNLLLTAWTAAVFIVLGAGLADKKLFPGYFVKVWATAIGLFAAILALLYCREDLSGTWIRLQSLAALSFAAAIVALWLRSAGHVFISGLLLNAAVTVAWIAWRPGEISTLIYLNVLSLACTSIIWTLLQIVYPESVPHVRCNNKSLPYAHFAAAIALLALGALAAFAVRADLMQLEHETVTPLGWYALIASAAAVGFCLWDRTARLPFLGLYVSGLITLGMVWDYLQQSPRMFCWRAGSDLAGYVLAAAVAGWLLPKMHLLGRWLRIPNDTHRWPNEWFMQLQTWAFSIVAVLNIWTALDFDFDGLGNGIALFGMSGRLVGITGFLMLLGAAIAMAWQSKSVWRTQWQYSAFIAGLLFLCSLRWAGIDPTISCPWLHRSIVLLISSAMMTLLCSFGLRKVISGASDWIAAGRQMIPFFGSLAILMLALVLFQEWTSYRDKIGTSLLAVEIVAVAVIVAAMLATCLAFAVRAEWDPLKLSLSGRQIYVYLAEALAVLIGIHLRLTKPEWFNFGFFQNYWMFIIMGIAFAGAGLSEWFHRLKLPVLSLPLQRTALLLPLLPAIGFWFQNDPETPLALIGRSPDVWLLMGAFYGLVSYMRRSLGCGLLAVLAANLALWMALHQFDILFLLHPQLWLIPIALAVLAAEFLHHNRLSEIQSTILRYLSLSIIYVSSTADMFIDMYTNGVNIDWRLPLVLMLLAVAGAMIGLFLRIRSFLILGITFLLLDIMTMIRYAAVDLEQTWIWYASGIVLGAIIIAIFAIFEKRRHDLLTAVQRFKQWNR